MLHCCRCGVAVAVVLGDVVVVAATFVVVDDCGDGGDGGGMPSTIGSSWGGNHFGNRCEEAGGMSYVR